MATQGKITFRAGNKSSSLPMNGEQNATVNAVRVNANDTCERDQPNSVVSGLRKMPNVKMTTDPKPTKLPQNAARRMSAGYTRLPGLRLPCPLLESTIAELSIKAPLYSKRSASARVGGVAEIP